MEGVDDENTILRLLQVVLLGWVLVIIGVNVLEPLRPVEALRKQAAAEEIIREIKESMKADISRSREHAALETDRKIRRL